MEKIEKKGISPVVATVLLVLITFMAVGILWGFILPMVREGLEEGGTCFELRDYAEIVESDFTCYNTSSSKTKIMIERDFDEVEIKGFKVTVTFGASSKPYILINNEQEPGVEMADGENKIKIPEPGGAETYVFNNVEGTRADLGVITKGGNVCDMGSYRIPKC